MKPYTNLTDEFTAEQAINRHFGRLAIGLALLSLGIFFAEHYGLVDKGIELLAEWITR